MDYATVVILIKKMVACAIFAYIKHL